MILNFLDSETTGLSQQAGHRFVEIAMLGFDSETRKLVWRYEQRIDPRRAIDPKAEAVHKIPLSSLIGEPTWEETADTVLKYLHKTDWLIAHNLDFDAGFLIGELARIGKELPSKVKGYCTMENGRWAHATGKKPSLKELCFACDVSYDEEKAHSALYDIAVTAKCFFRGLDFGHYKLEDEK